MCHTFLCEAAAAGRTRPQGALNHKQNGGLQSFLCFVSLSIEDLFTFVFEVLQDGDDGFQGNAVGQKQLPGAILLEGLPLE